MPEIASPNSNTTRDGTQEAAAMRDFSALYVRPIILVLDAKASVRR